MSSTLSGPPESAGKEQHFVRPVQALLPPPCFNALHHLKVHEPRGRCKERYPVKCFLSATCTSQFELKLANMPICAGNAAYLPKM
eukprot:1147585-Pelagomonas_calceolata.AAC.3